MPEKRESGRSVAQYDLVLSHADIIDMMEDPQVGLNPEADQQIYLFIRKANGAEINLALRPIYDDDKLVFRFFKVTDTSADEVYTDVDIS